MRVNPEHIESLKLEDDFDFATMLKESERGVEQGKIQEGVIVRIDSDYAMVAVSGAKREGRLPIAEIQDEQGVALFKVGDKLEIYVSGSQERLNISHKKVEKIKKLERKIEEIKNDFKGLVLSCEVIKKNKGGYIVEFDGVEAFLPKRESALKEDHKTIGRHIKVVVIGIDEAEKTIIVSRKKYLAMMDKNREENIQKLLQNDGVLQGSVVRVMSFGIFVDVDGVEGFVHHTEFSHKGASNPASTMNVGDQVNVKVLRFDPEKKKLSFSIKATLEDPWKEIKDNLEIGDTIRVTVSKIESYGAFVDLGNGTEGFLHISEMSWDKRLQHPSDVIKEGEEINVEIIEIDNVKRRLRVSLKKMMPKPFSQFVKRVKVGDVLEGKVVKILDFGAFINLGEVDGLLHNEDLSWDKSKKVSSLNVGDSISVKVMKINPTEEKISLSVKNLEESPLDRFVKEVGIDSVVKGSVTGIKDFGVFVSLGEIEALIRDEDLYPLKKEEIKIGDEIEGAIAYIDHHNSKVRMSVKRLERAKEREQLNQYNSSGTKMTLGDILKRRD